MDSSDLNYFSQWVSFNKKNIKTATISKGVYVFRLDGGKLIPRLQGVSDIMYIGSTKAKKGIRQRLHQYIYPGSTQWTNIRIKALSKKYQMEIAWFSSDEPGNKEHELLNQFLTDHDELPPLNHAGRSKLEKLLSETKKPKDNLELKLTKGINNKNTKGE